MKVVDLFRQPFDGPILGAPDISGSSGSHNTHSLVLVIAGGGSIETKLAAQELERRTRFLDVIFTQTRAALSSSTAVVDRHREEHPLLKGGTPRHHPDRRRAFQIRIAFQARKKTPS
jgi:hypothetical protein